MRTRRFCLPFFSICITRTSPISFVLRTCVPPQGCRSYPTISMSLTRPVPIGGLTDMVFTKLGAASSSASVIQRERTSAPAAIISASFLVISSLSSPVFGNPLFAITMIRHDLTAGAGRPFTARALPVARSLHARPHGRPQVVREAGRPCGRACKDRTTGRARAVKGLPAPAGRSCRIMVMAKSGLPKTGLDKEEITRKLAEMIAAGADVRSRWITDAELEAAPNLVKTMSVKPPIGTGRVRLIEIVGYDLQPCGGTHVRNPNEIGDGRVTQIVKEGRQNRRGRIVFS